jgi:hypothetical protein
MANPGTSSSIAVDSFDDWRISGLSEVMVIFNGVNQCTLVLNDNIL